VPSPKNENGVELEVKRPYLFIPFYISYRTSVVLLYVVGKNYFISRNNFMMNYACRPYSYILSCCKYVTQVILWLFQRRVWFRVFLIS